ncbi:MAG: hypothetical protein M3Q05_09015 [Bacteroidota bacterium]|nr:hypothetical protein [Bacteroidota bacterium]
MIKVTKPEWQEDPAFPFKYHLFGLVESTSGKQERKLLASYWRTRDCWNWYVFLLKRGLFKKQNTGSSSSEEEARDKIYTYLKLQK